MKTERLYYDDPRLLEFDAAVVESIPIGENIGVILDKTAFYPTSGGQPHDVGSLGNIQVLDVYEDDASGAVVHVVRQKVEEKIVHGVVDAVRRRDHMQQHSGQHVLSQAFVELFNWPTVSFHLGVAHCTIDLPVEAIRREDASRAEDLANRIVQDNRPVAICYVAHEDAAQAGLRKPTERVGDIRIIDIAGYDRSACGGTHVRMTGEIGPILVLGIERAKKQSRVSFICGDRVLRYAREANKTLEAISQTISASPMETASGVRNVWDELQKSRKRIEELELKLLDYEAAEYPVKDGMAIGVFENRGIDAVKLLASRIAARPGTIVLMADLSDQLRVVFARSADVPVDMAAVLKKVLERFGGRGGGRPVQSQGGGLIAANPLDVLNFAIEVIGRK